MNELLSELQKLAPGIHWAVIGALEISEDEITKARVRHPEHSKTIWNSFKLLCPSVYLREAPEPVYRAHCAELLDRVAQGLDTTLGTRGEVMMGLSAVSLKSPLKHTAAVLYAQLFQEIYPDSPMKNDIRQLADMGWVYQASETLIAKLSKKCRDPGRKLAKGK